MANIVIEKTDAEIKAGIEKIAEVTATSTEINNALSGQYNAITDKNGSTGTSGQVLTALGDGTCEWQ